MKTYSQNFPDMHTINQTALPHTGRKWGNHHRAVHQLRKTRTSYCSHRFILHRNRTQTGTGSKGQIYSADPWRAWNPDLCSLPVCDLHLPHKAGHCNGNIHSHHAGNPGRRTFYIREPGGETTSQRRLRKGMSDYPLFFMGDVDFYIYFT